MRVRSEELQTHSYYRASPQDHITMVRNLRAAAEELRMRTCRHAVYRDLTLHCCLRVSRIPSGPCNTTPRSPRDRGRRSPGETARLLRRRAHNNDEGPTARGMQLSRTDTSDLLYCEAMQRLKLGPESCACWSNNGSDWTFDRDWWSAQTTNRDHFRNTAGITSPAPDLVRAHSVVCFAHSASSVQCNAYRAQNVRLSA